MRKVHSFGQNPPAYPLRLAQYTSSPYGEYLRVSCFTLHSQLYGGLYLPRNWFSHTWSGSRFGPQKRRTPKGPPLKRYEGLPYWDHASYP